MSAAEPLRIVGQIGDNPRLDLRPVSDLTPAELFDPRLDLTPPRQETHMTHREQILTKIAELYPELVDPLNGPSSLPGDGQSLGLMPNTYTTTVREYERLVKQMRDDRSHPLINTPQGKLSVRSAWWHLEHWHHRATRTIKHQAVTKPGKHGHRIALRNADGSPVTAPTIAIHRDPQADERKAQHAITWIAQHWQLATEPMLPQAILEGFKAAA